MSRYAALESLLEEFKAVGEVFEDRDRVNEILFDADRADLELSDPVAMMPVQSPEQLGSLNNFVPNMTAFGVAIRRLVRLYRGAWEVRQVGYRPYNDEEVGQLRKMAGLGDYRKAMDVAISCGIPEVLATGALDGTHILKPAFGRMWTAFPTLSSRVLSSCLERPNFRGKNASKPQINQELYVAYSVMSRLVDRRDNYVMRDGVVDGGYLCR